MFFLFQKIRTIELDGKTIKLQIVSFLNFLLNSYSAMSDTCCDDFGNYQDVFEKRKPNSVLDSNKVQDLKLKCQIHKKKVFKYLC